MKNGQQSLLGYLPAGVIKSILDKTVTAQINFPLGIPLNTVSLFADISGFTKLSEKFSRKGRGGSEFLAFCLNRYMEQLINIICNNGGDIFKFAGDALLVIWPSTATSNLTESCRRAIQCAATIQKRLNNIDMGAGNKLSVKIGLGVGNCKIFFVGGKFNRSEYLIVGSAMKQACCSECHIEAGGEIVVSEKVYNLVFDIYEFDEKPANSAYPDSHDMRYFQYKGELPNKAKLQVKAEASLMRTAFSIEAIANSMPVLRSYVPNAITTYLDIEKENWCKEIRLVTILFVSISIDLKDTETPQGEAKIQQVIYNIQRCVYRTRGSLNKFLMDDKGSVLLLCWGLPPFSSHDDPVRAVLSALDILNVTREQHNVNALIGITTGCVFSGVCGCSGGRREYSLLGEVVNLSARFMQTTCEQYKKKLANKKPNEKPLGIIYLDESTKKLIQNKIFCEYQLTKLLKGFNNPFDHYSPIVEDKEEKVTFESIFSLIKTHRNNRYQSNIESGNQSMKLVGLLSAKGIFAKRFEESQRTNSQLLFISGILGSGKSFFVRSQIATHLKPYMNDISSILFITNQSPITQKLLMNGFQDTMRRMFAKLKRVPEMTLDRKNYKIDSDVFVSGDEFFKLINDTNNFYNIPFIEEILDDKLLNKHYFIDPKSGPCKIPELKKNRDPFFERTEVNCKDDLKPGTTRSDNKINSNEDKVADFFVKLVLTYRKHISSTNPLVFVVEDCQLIDSLSIAFISLLNKYIDEAEQDDKDPIKNIFMVCTYQHALCALKDADREQNDKLNAQKISDIFIIENTIAMTPMLDPKDIDELLSYNITTVVPNEKLSDAEEEKMKEDFTKGVKTNLKREEIIPIDQVDPKALQLILLLSFKGNPLFLIEVTQSLIEQEVLEIKNKTICLKKDYSKLPEHDYSELRVPFIMEKVIGNIIDALKVTEIIILKHASVIGNIFDIDKLSDIIQFPSITFDDLVEMLKYFESLGLIEILYDLHPKRMVAMFTIPFMREILYQRMLTEHKCEIHRMLARKMQFAKFSYISKKTEGQILKHHLEGAEKTLMSYIQEDADAENIKNSGGVIEKPTESLGISKALITREIFEKLKIIDLKIQSDFYPVEKNIPPKLLNATLKKKSDNQAIEEERYCVITNQKFCYYYSETEFKKNAEPLGEFFIKSIYQITQLAKESNNKFILEIKVSVWINKGVPRNDRTFIFGFSTREELNKWEVALNFLRIKIMYDEFTSSFGMIQLPLVDSNRYYPKKIKRKLNIKSKDARNLTINSGTTQGKPKSSFVTKKTLNNTTSDFQSENDEQAQLQSLSDNVNQLFANGLCLFFGVFQERIYKQGLDLKYCPEHMRTAKRDDCAFADFIQSEGNNYDN